ncbi:MAG: MFS transporter [Alphaproteobacteria bacterium]
MKLLLLATGAMTLQQVFSTISANALSVIAPAVAAGLGVSPALIGPFSAIVYGTSMLGGLSCGSAIRRHGGLRMSQVGLLMCASGLMLAGLGILPLLTIAAALVGVQYGIGTPASSQILTRYAPPRLAPLIFSVKQTGVPLGHALAGFMLPFLVAQIDWRGALFVTGILCVAVMVGLEPLRAEFDKHREGRAAPPFSLGAIFANLRELMAQRALRDLAWCAMAYVGIQTSFVTFFVTYLVDGLAITLQDAGGIFAISLAIAAGARIFWGWLSGITSARPVLAVIGFGAVASAVAVGLYDRDWSHLAIAIAATGTTVTAVGWHGVVLAEIARLSPPEKVAPRTGGLLGFGSIAQVTFPMIVSGLYGLTGDYGTGFFVIAIPSLIATINILRPLPRDLAPPNPPA